MAGLPKAFAPDIDGMAQPIQREKFMNKHSYQLLTIHLMAAAMCGLCMVAANIPGKEFFYLPAGVLIVVVFGTLKDYMQQALSDLRKC